MPRGQEERKSIARMCANANKAAPRRVTESQVTCMFLIILELRVFQLHPLSVSSLVPSSDLVLCVIIFISNFRKDKSIVTESR